MNKNFRQLEISIWEIKNLIYLLNEYIMYSVENKKDYHHMAALTNILVEKSILLCKLSADFSDEMYRNYG